MLHALQHIVTQNRAAGKLPELDMPTAATDLDGMIPLVPWLKLNQEGQQLNSDIKGLFHCMLPEMLVSS